ncbi:MAG: hypothetical protein P9M07_00790 [Candidatus Aceula meridiana]|nr:hypothetical protein [Candidatus Aceula meridiana]
MFNRAGKTSVIFLIVFSILLLSLTAITMFLFQKERELRKMTEAKLEMSQENHDKVVKDLEEAKQQIFILDEQKKEIQEKIEGILDDLELEKGLREEMKNESLALSKEVDSLTAEKERFQQAAIELREKADGLEDQLAEEQNLRQEAQAELERIVQWREQDFPSEGGDEVVDEGEDVSLDKIVVSSEEKGFEPGGIIEIEILKVNAENNFIIINVGKSGNVEENTVAQVFRGDKLLGEVKITRVQKSMSVADVVPPLTASEIKINDKVVLKE